MSIIPTAAEIRDNEVRAAEVRAELFSHKHTPERREELTLEHWALTGHAPWDR